MTKHKKKKQAEALWALTSYLAEMLSSISESFGSTTSWKGGNVDTFLLSDSSLSLNLECRTCDLSFRALLSEWWGWIKLELDWSFCDDSEKLPFCFLVMWASSSIEGLRLFWPKLEKLTSVARCSFDMALGSLKPILGIGCSSRSGWFSLGFFKESLETLPESLLKSLKALLDSFESLEGLSLCSLDGLWSLSELLLMLLLVVVMVRALPLLDPSCTQSTKD